MGEGRRGEEENVLEIDVNIIPPFPIAPETNYVVRLENKDLDFFGPRYARSHVDLTLNRVK